MKIYIKFLASLFTKKTKYVKYIVYCEKDGGSYHPECVDSFYKYETPYLYVAEEDLSAVKIIGVDKKGNKQTIYEL